MIRSTLLLAIRTLRRRLRYTTINAVGLTVGLAACLLVTVFIQHELSWDAHHDGADRTYRILSQYNDTEYSHIRFEGFQDDTDDAEEQRELTRRLPEAVPGIEAAANYILLEGERFVEDAEGDRFTLDRVLITTSGASLVDVFTFERMAGAPLEDALAAPGSAILTVSAARKYGGSPEAMVNRTLTVGATEVTVRAVVADPPSNSRVQFDVAMHLPRSPFWAAHQYVRLSEDADRDAVEAQVSNVMDAVDPSRRDDDRLKGDRLQALTDIYLAPYKSFDRGPHRDATYLWIFAAIGLLILSVTIINYTNLSMALYADRHDEVGVRKAIGGHPRQIAGQFLTEAVVLVLACAPLAIALVSALLPAFNALMDTSIASARLLHPTNLTALLALAVGTGLLSGGYPAIVLARKQAAHLFQFAFRSGGTRGWSLRHGLIALQFVVLIVLGSLSWIAFDQLRYMQDESLAYQTDNVVRLPGESRDTVAYERWRQRLLSSSAIAAVGMGPEPRPRIPTSPFALSDDPETIYDEGQVRTVDVHWFDVVGIEHPIIDEMQSEGAAAPERVFINETAAELLEGTNPIGQEWINDAGGGNFTTSTIVGVLPDFYFHSMRSEIAPTAYRVYESPPWSTSILVRFVPGRTTDGLAHVRTVWAEERPNQPFQPTFMNDLVGQLYEQERRFTTLSGVLAGLAILLAAIGLAGLVAYLTRLRLREIGIRKALGGTTWSIVGLLNREYLQLVGVAVLLGAPLAWWLAQRWLAQFAMQVDVSLLVFAGTGALTILIAVGAVSLQAGRAARISPARVLRSE